MVAVDYLGIVDYCVYEGAGTGERLFWYTLISLIPMLNPYPGPRSVLILDNVPFHFNAAFLQILAFIGVIVIFLPTYAPFLNLADRFFNQLKEAIQSQGEIFGTNPIINTIGLIEQNRYINYFSELIRIGYGKHCLLF